MHVMRITICVAVLLVLSILSAGAASRDYFAGDVFLAREVQDVQVTPWEETMEVASFIGKGWPTAAIALVCFLWFLWRKMRAEYVVTAGAMLSLGLNPVLKFLIDRPRPTEGLITVWRDYSGLSFPSGHAFTAVILFGLLFYFAPLLLPWKRAVFVVRAFLIPLILLIGISRIYLGAHWPSDVIGGFLYGAVILGLLIYFHRLQSPQKVLSLAG